MHSRRKLLKQLALFSLSSALVSFPIKSKQEENNAPLILKKIPSTGEKIPPVGMGSWLTFDVGYRNEEMSERVKVLKIFFNEGGTFIDSSPMYGRSERVIGKCLEKLKIKDNRLFSASKIWTPNGWHGKKQFSNSLNLWKLNSFCLMQVHNLVNYESHLEYLYELKRNGIIKYVGVTTSHGWRHDKLKLVMENYNLDFVQLTYNIIDDEAEKVLLPLAYEKNIAIISNRPFQGGNLFNYVHNKKLPENLKEYDINSWADLFLKFIISHKSITCVIPATSKSNHMKENMKSLYGYQYSNKERDNIKNIFLNI